MPSALNQAFQCEAVPPEIMDQLWAAGWRHFGDLFFRYSETEDMGGLNHITPLRMDLVRFTPSKSQRRVLRKNADLRTEFVPAELSADVHAMFEKHKARFQTNVPEGLSSFLSQTPATVPCPCLACQVWSDGVLVAVSFLDIGAQATSSVYGIFDPDYSARSLGIFTMLKEIEFSMARSSQYYYPGYATHEPSAYDYKKKFAALEILDWETGTWQTLADRQEAVE